MELQSKQPSKETEDTNMVVGSTTPPPTTSGGDTPSTPPTPLPRKDMSPITTSAPSSSSSPSALQRTANEIERVLCFTDLPPCGGQCRPEEEEMENVQEKITIKGLAAAEENQNKTAAAPAATDTSIVVDQEEDDGILAAAAQAPTVLQRATIELERVLCFTDVPCGALRFNPPKKKKTTSATTAPAEEETTTMATKLERALLFTDLKDADDCQQSTDTTCANSDDPAFDDPALDDSLNVEVRMNPDDLVPGQVDCSKAKDLSRDTSALTNPSVSIKFGGRSGNNGDQIDKSPTRLGSSLRNLFGKKSASSRNINNGNSTSNNQNTIMRKSSSENNVVNKKRVMRTRQSLWRHAQECEYDSNAFDITDPEASERSSNRSSNNRSSTKTATAGTKKKKKRGFSFRRSTFRKDSSLPPLPPSTQMASF